MDAQPLIIDLSWPVFPGMPMFPGDPPVEHRPMGQYATHGFVSHLISLPAHSGTHMDAPAHVIKGGAALADMPLSRFMGPGAVLDLRARPGREVRAQDIAPLLAEAAGAAFVLLRTGDAERWGQDGYYTAGSYLTPGAAELLAALPGLSGIGLDAGSVDPADSRELPAHRALLGAGLVIVENLRGLELAQGRAFTFLCLPVLGCDGSPVRAAALLEMPGGAQ
ncbi:MAG: cyclase family protein [Desulfovibrio sp.]|jgi:kynurenine formamidase|nr:cyclase family protein [Desulfovibrio sp.]